MGKFLKPCVGLSVGKLDWVCGKLQRIVNRVFVARKLVWKSKSGRFGVRPMVALSSFRLAYNVPRADAVPAKIEINP